MAYKFPRSRMKRLMSKKSTKQYYPRKKLPKGLKVRGGFATSIPLRRRTIDDPIDVVGKVFDSAKERGANVANDMMAKMAQQAIDAASDAASAAATKGAAKAKEYIKTKISGDAGASAKGPTKVFTEDPTMSSSSISVGVRRINNAVVPDKTFNTEITQGGMTKKEEKFYTKWPLQDLLIYQSKTPGRFLHTVSPGNKSFYWPFPRQPIIPAWSDYALYRKAVEVSSNQGIGVPTAEPPFYSSNTDYGTVQGGLDFHYPLTLGTFSDMASCISAMTPDVMPSIPTNYRLGGNYKMCFGIPKLTLDFHIENQNKFLPAQFTVQVHEYRGQTGEVPPNLNPLNSVFYNEDFTVPKYGRSFAISSTVPVANDPGAIATYSSENSLLHNAPTFGNNSWYRNVWKMVASNKVRVTAGGRLKCKVSLNLPPYDALERLIVSGNSSADYLARSRQLYVTILAQGTQEVYGDVYTDGNFSYSTNFMTNPVQYTVSNITKKAKVYAPNLQLQTAGTAGFEQANVTFGKFTEELFAFGETTQSMFVPEGQYNIPYEALTDEDNIPSTGRSLVIPLMTNQTRESASTRRVN